MGIALSVFPSLINVVVNGTVHFDNQSTPQADEIRNIRADRNQSSKVRSGQVRQFLAKSVPKAFLSIFRLRAKAWSVALGSSA